MEYHSNLLHKVASRYCKLYVISNTMDHFVLFCDCHETFKTVALTLKRNKCKPNVYTFTAHVIILELYSTSDTKDPNGSHALFPNKI